MSQIDGPDWGPAQDEQLRQAWVNEPPRLSGRVQLAEYDPSWPGWYEREARTIRAALADRVLLLEHIGSTSVPGLAAKPVIDLIVAGIAPEDEAAREALEEAGYALLVDEPGHRMYRCAEAAAHVHLWADTADVERHLIFRDRLRENAEDRALYEHVKRRLTERSWETRDRYADAKSAVVDTILRRARGNAFADRSAAFAERIYAHLPAGSRILEIGAGEGRLAARLRDAGYDVVALDPALRSFCPIVETTFEAYHAPAESFDGVAAQFVLHHVADLTGTLEKVRALLRPGGTVAIDDYGWERSRDPEFREARLDLHTAQTMLAALRGSFEETSYGENALFDGDEDRLAFTFTGSKRETPRTR